MARRIMAVRAAWRPTSISGPSGAKSRGRVPDRSDAAFPCGRARPRARRHCLLPVCEGVLAFADRRFLIRAGITALLVLVSCSRPAAVRGGDDASVGDAGMDSATSILAPLANHAWLEPIALPSGHRAVIAVPLGAMEPRPIVVGVHGAGDRAEWACGGYRIATGAFPFVVCPEGVSAGGEKFSTADSKRLESDIRAAVDATRTIFGTYVAPGPLLYAGFSLGAMHGVAVVSHSGALFPRVLLLEGAFRGWSPKSARQFVDGGGARVMLVCAAATCDAAFAGAKRDLEQAGAKVEIVAAGTRRHNLDGPMMKVLAHHWPWLVEGDTRWDGFLPPATP